MHNQWTIRPHASKTLTQLLDPDGIVIAEIKNQDLARRMAAAMNMTSENDQWRFINSQADDGERPWIELEFEVGRARYTYWGVGLAAAPQTLIRWEWMNFKRWGHDKAEFFAKHPGVIVRTRSWRKVDVAEDKALDEWYTPEQVAAFYKAAQGAKS